MATFEERISDKGLKEAEITFDLGDEVTQEEIDAELENIRKLKEDTKK